MAVEQYLLGAPATALSTGLNSLANNARALSSAYSNIQGGGEGEGYPLVDIELVVQYGSAPAARSGWTIWFLGSVDGTNYEDGDASVRPTRPHDIYIEVRADTTLQKHIRRLSLPPGLLKVLAENTATGQATASSGNTIKIRPVTYEGVVA